LQTTTIELSLGCEGFFAGFFAAEFFVVFLGVTAAGFTVSGADGSFCPLVGLWLVPVGFCLVLVRLWLGVAREDFALGRILAIEETMQQPFPG
jgi:hypothetical protein